MTQVTETHLIYKHLWEKILFVGFLTCLIKVSSFFFSIQCLNVSVHTSVSVKQSLFSDYTRLIKLYFIPHQRLYFLVDWQEVFCILQDKIQP